MGVNKVEYGGNTLIDLTNDNVSPDRVFEGDTFHGANGERKSGTFTLDSELTIQEVVIDQIKMALRNKASGSDSGNSEEAVASLLDNTMTDLNNSIVTSLRTRACQYATALVTVNLPSCKTLNTYVFYGCTALTTAHFPVATSIPSQSFYNCTKLKHADFGAAGSIAAQAFNANSSLTELILRKSDSICTLSNVNGVNNTPIGKGTGYVYVPRALIDTYKANTNWSTFANQFRAIEDYPEICG